MLRETTELLEKNSTKKSKAQITANELVPMWIYVLINSDINNIITESVLMQEFRLKDQSLMNESDYHLTNILAAIDHLNKDDNKTPKPSATNIVPYVIYSGGSNNLGLTDNQTYISKTKSMQPVYPSSSYVTPGGGGGFSGSTPNPDNNISNQTPYYNSMQSSIKNMMKKNEG